MFSQNSLLKKIKIFQKVLTTRNKSSIIIIEKRKGVDKYGLIQTKINENGNKF